MSEGSGQPLHQSRILRQHPLCPKHCTCILLRQRRRRADLFQYGPSCTIIITVEILRALTQARTRARAMTRDRAMARPRLRARAMVSSRARARAWECIYI